MKPVYCLMETDQQQVTSLVCACVGSRSVLVLLHSLPYPVPCPEFCSPMFTTYVRRTVKLSLKIQAYAVFSHCFLYILYVCEYIPHVQLMCPHLPFPPLPSPPPPPPPPNQLRHHSRMRHRRRCGHCPRLQQHCQSDATHQYYCTAGVRV